MAEILYEKYNYNSLSTDLVRDLINNNNRYTTEEINEINFNLDLININIDLDVKGTFTLYLKNLGLLKILNTFLFPTFHHIFYESSVQNVGIY